MLGWSIRARACRSASNRASTWRRVHAGLDDLQGHLAADGPGPARPGRPCPCPPRRSAASSLYGPMTAPGPSAAARGGGDGPESRARDVAGREVTGPASVATGRPTPPPSPGNGRSARGPAAGSRPGPQPRIAPAGPVQVGRPPRPVEPGEGLEEDRLGSGVSIGASGMSGPTPSCSVRARSPPKIPKILRSRAQAGSSRGPSWPKSQVRAKAQSRSAVRRPMPRAAAACSTVRPAK